MPEPGRDTLRRAVEAERLDPARSLAAIRAAARQRRCLSYAAVAAASFLPWHAARRQMDPHLFKLCAEAKAHGWPLLSAIVVNKHLVAERRMEGRTLAGFTAMANRLGARIGTDPAAFLRSEQDRVFDWAEREAAHDLHH
jgi:DhnA family fructose-bisphosphate aldolase class Ia